MSREDRIRAMDTQLVAIACRAYSQNIIDRLVAKTNMFERHPLEGCDETQPTKGDER